MTSAVAHARLLTPPADGPLTADRRRRRWAGALMLAGALAISTLGACAQIRQQTGAAATIGSTTITETRLQDELTELSSAVPGGVPDTAKAAKALLSWQINAAVMDAFAAKNQVVASQGDVDALIAQAGGRGAVESQLAAQNSVPPSELDAYARLVVLSKGLQRKVGASAGAGMAAQAASMGISVSPRYGSWDTTKGLQDFPNLLSTPAPVDAAASPSAALPVPAAS